MTNELSDSSSSKSLQSNHFSKNFRTEIKNVQGVIRGKVYSITIVNFKAFADLYKLHRCS